MSLENIALFTALHIRCSTFSRAKFWVEDLKGNVKEDHKFTQLLDNPNYSSSRQDFLYKHLWYKSLGNNITRIIPNKPKYDLSNLDHVGSLEHLIPNKINYQEINKQSKMMIADSDEEELESRKIIYTLSGEEKEIEVKELLFFYDICNGLRDEEYFKSPSRIDALIPALSNIDQAQKSKNINLKFSSKFLTTNKTFDRGVDELVPMTPDEKVEVENTIWYKDIIASQKDLAVHSLANDFTKLLYSQELASEAQQVLGAYGINSDILNWFLAGQSTYENKKFAIPQWIQSDIAVEAEDFANTYSNQFKLKDNNEVIKSSFDHLPAMAVLKEVKEQAKERQVKMFETLMKSGMEKEEAMKVSGLDKILEDAEGK